MRNAEDIPATDAAAQSSAVHMRTDGLPVIRGEADAPASKMSAEDLIALDQVLLTGGDYQAAELLLRMR